MRYYLAFDGGGSKLQGILFDDGYHLISSARAGGINGNVHNSREVEAHVSECLRQLFAQAGTSIPRIERIFTSWEANFAQAVQMFCPCGEVTHLSEGCLGVLSCGRKSGICALSGTGSDVFYIENTKEIDAIGGWGYLLGDDGSGVWIGQHAARSMLYHLEQNQEGTYLHQLLREKYKPGTASEMISAVYRAKSPPYELGTCCELVNRAAMAGDPTAKEILRDAGQTLGRSVGRMLEKHHLSGRADVCTTGSVFQYCGDMRSAFDGYIRENLPDCILHHALFEPIVGCILYQMSLGQAALDGEELGFLQREYRDFRAADGINERGAQQE